jgi:hypothetical protein
MPKKSDPTVIEQAKAQLATAETLTLAEASVYSGLSVIYIRRAINTGKLVAFKEPVKDGSKTLRNVMSREAFDLWRAETATHSKREDGRNKFVVYMNPDEAAKLLEIIKGMEFAETLQRANVKPATETEEA